MRHEMSIATIEGAVEEVADEMAGPERAISPPIGAEATQEAGGDGAHRASLARRRKEVEETLAALTSNAAEIGRLAATTAVLGTMLVGSDVYARAGELAQFIMAESRPVSELDDLLRWGHERAQAARTLQVAVRCHLRQPLGPRREPHSRRPVMPGSVAMFAQGGAYEVLLQRLRHGAGQAWEVHAAAARCGLPLEQWLAGDPAARRWQAHAFSESVAVKMQRGTERAIEASVSLARTHAARRILWAFRRRQLRRLLTQYRAGQAQLEEWREARKARRKTARARARARDSCMGWSEPQQEEAAFVAAVNEGCASPGRAGGKARVSAGCRWAMGALLAAGALWGSAITRPALVPLAVHHLPRSPGVRFNGRDPSRVELLLRLLWLQSSPAAEQATVQVVEQGSRGRRGMTNGSDGYRHPDEAASVGPPTRCASQSTTLREAFRLAEGPWALPRPPEWELRESWWAKRILMQEQRESASAVDGGEGCSVGVRLQMGGLIVEELVGRCHCVSRWPEHIAPFCGWRKGHPDFVHPDVVLAASTSSGRVRRSGHLVWAATMERFLGPCQWSRSGAPHQRAPACQIDDVQVGV